VLLTNGEGGGGGSGGYGSRRKFVDEYLYERLFLAAKPFTAAILKALALSRRERDLDLDADCEKDLLVQSHVRAPSPTLKQSPRPQLDSKITSLSFPPRGIPMPIPTPTPILHTLKPIEYTTVIPILQPSHFLTTPSYPF
jgi:hypothetical protein